MIVKEIDAPTSKDRFSQAGFKAEQKMAQYLSRAFKDAEDNPSLERGQTEVT